MTEIKRGCNLHRYCSHVSVSLTPPQGLFNIRWTKCKCWFSSLSTKATSTGIKNRWWKAQWILDCKRPMARNPTPKEKVCWMCQLAAICFHINQLVKWTIFSSCLHLYSWAKMFYIQYYIIKKEMEKYGVQFLPPPPPPQIKKENTLIVRNSNQLMSHNYSFK